MSPKLEHHDIAAHRLTPLRQYSRWDRIRLLAWGLAGILFRGSPRHLYGWRNQLLRIFGARIGRSVRVYPSVRIFAPWNLAIGDEVTIAWGVTLYNLAPIAIGNRTIVSQKAHLCSGNHDCRQAHLPFKNRPIVVGDDCWICADAFVGSGVTLGRLAVVAARAVVIKSVPERKIVGGNPAAIIGER
jgi:putative colanic acid biosynthesis acetyltransferase WcaF